MLAGTEQRLAGDSRQPMWPVSDFTPPAGLPSGPECTSGPLGPADPATSAGPAGPVTSAFFNLALKMGIHVMW